MMHLQVLFTPNHQLLSRCQVVFELASKQITTVKVGGSREEIKHCEIVSEYASMKRSVWYLPQAVQSLQYKPWIFPGSCLEAFRTSFGYILIK